ncbi:MAG: NAD-dependent epimerase/dehydratase family protein [Solirubrobacterales bacterium]
MGGWPADRTGVNLALQMRVLITGGAGFVGASLGISLAARHPDWELVAYDNLHRRGSELNLPRLEAAGIGFVAGDVRNPEALMEIDRIDALVECSAEPSALAGTDGETAYTVHTNLTGAYNCLELARRDGAQLVFLSTSRVYPIRSQSELSCDEGPTRFELSDGQALPGASSAGISEEFPLEGARTLYGATKLAAELLIEEYADGFGLQTVIDRCGVITGPWQMGKVDQGVFAFWLFHHHFGLPLSYIGYGGTGKQVRDLLHVDDLVELVDEQLSDPEGWAGFVGNVGGGRDNSLSLLETTAICRELTGVEVPIESVPETRPGDVPIFLADCARLFQRTDWRPSRDPGETLTDIHRWTVANESSLAEALGLDAAARVS